MARSVVFGLVSRTVFAVAVAAGAVSAAARYNVIDLSHHLDTLSYCMDMNDRNQVVGYGFIRAGEDGSSLRRAFVYRDGARHELPPAHVGKECLALGINDSGVVVGCTYESAPGPEAERIHYACVWNDTGITELGTFGGIRSMACDINNSGQIAGYYSVRTADTHQDYVYVYESGRATVLTIPEGWPEMPCGQRLVRNYHERIDLDSYPRYYTRIVTVQINERGDVMASFSSNIGKTGTVLWTEGAVVNLNERVSRDDVSFFGVGLVENDAIAGFEGLCRRPTGDSGTVVFPALWTGERVRQLSYYTEHGMNSVRDINAAGQIVGSLSFRGASGASASRAVTWEADTAAFLNDCIDSSTGWDVTIAEAINDSGFIVGCGRRDGKTRACMLAPRPSAVVLPENGRLIVTLTKASASLVSDIYLMEPDSLLLIANNLVNVGATVDTVYRLGTELRFAIAVQGSGGVYVHHSDSKFAKVHTISPTEWTIHFEDLPEEQADWDYNDVVIHVVLSPVSAVADRGGMVRRAQPYRTVTVYDLLGRRVALPDIAGRSGVHAEARVSSGAFVVIEQGGARAAVVRTRGAQGHRPGRP